MRFDALGRHCETFDRNGIATRYRYDNGRLHRIDYPGGAFLDVLCGEDGRLRAIRDHAERTTRFELEGRDLAAAVIPDADGRPLSTTQMAA